VQTRQGLRKALIIPRQPAKSRSPAKATFDHPATRQQDKAFFRCSMLTDQQINAMPVGLVGCPFARISLVNEGDLDSIACDLLNGLRQLFHL